MEQKPIDETKAKKTVEVTAIWAAFEVLIRKLKLYDLFPKWPDNRGFSIIEFVTHFLAGSAIYGMLALHSDKYLYEKLFGIKLAWEIFQQFEFHNMPPKTQQYIFFDGLFDIGAGMLGGWAMEKFLKK